MIKKIRVTVDGKPYEVTVEIPDDAPGMPAPVHAPPSATPPKIATPAASSPSVAAAAPGDVPSPLAGHVVGVAVALAQAVKKGDPLVTIEAMKMNTFVLAPSDGKVTALPVKVGDVVGEGQVLARVE